MQQLREGESVRIAIIAHALRAGGGVSVGMNLIRSFSRVAPENSYLFILPAHVGYENLNLTSFGNRIEYFEMNAGYLGRLVFDELRLPRLIREFLPDVVLGLGNRGMTAPPCTQAVFCQDAHLFYAWKHFGKETWFNYAANAYKKWIFRRSLRHTALLLCQTPIAEIRLKQIYKYNGKTALLPNAVSLDSLAGDRVLGKPAVLNGADHALKLFCLTRYYSHKNLETIVEMFVRFRQELRDVLVILTIAADDHPNARSLLCSIDTHQLAQNIFNVGPLKQEEISGYYRHCSALFLPTLLESFTATYLEAMQFACPILTSDLDFAHQICGDAAMYFNPWNISHMKDVILEFKNRPELASHMVERGSKQIRCTYQTWDSVALQTCEDLRDSVSTQSRAPHTDVTR